jgi:flagellar biogenesis protein FliO
MDPDVFRGMGAVLFVLALLSAALWALRRAGLSSRVNIGSRAGVSVRRTEDRAWERLVRKCLGGRSSTGHSTTTGTFGAGRNIEAIDRLTLAPQHSLHLLRAGGRELLVAIHPQGCTLLANFSSQERELNSGENPAKVEVGAATC